MVRWILAEIDLRSRDSAVGALLGSTTQAACKIRFGSETLERRLSKGSPTFLGRTNSLHGKAKASISPTRKMETSRFTACPRPAVHPRDSRGPMTLKFGN